MAEDNQFEMNQLSQEMGIPLVRPSEGQYQWAASFQPLYKTKATNNQAYQQKVQRMARLISNENVQNSFNGMPISLNGHYIYKNLSTPYNYNAQQNIRDFLKFNQADNFMAFDIESMGDPVNFGKFGLTEIAANEFTRTNGDIKLTPNRFFRLINPGKEVLYDSERLIRQLETDPYAFRRMSNYQKRKLVDLMRYSTLPEKGQAPATFTTENDVVTNFRHNSIASTFFDNETLNENKVIAEMNRVIPHMRSGLNMLSSNQAMNSKKALSQYSQFVRKNQNVFFLSHNGANFDLPALQAAAQKVGVRMAQPAKHLDLLQTISTLYPNITDLHRELNPKFNGRLPMGGRKLQSLIQTLGLQDTGLAHSAMDDEQDMARVMAKIGPVLKNKIETSKTKIKEGFNYHPTGFSWNDEPLRVGDQLFASGGVKAYLDGESSFMMEGDRQGHYKLKNDGFNTTFVNAKTFYQVKGLHDLSDEKTRRLALELYDKENDRKVFISREGDHAFDEIGAFVQSRFYNWRGITPNQRREIGQAHLRDQARRRYESMFSLEGGGTGLTKGFESAERLYGNAAVYAKRLAGKEKNIERRARERAKKNGTTIAEERKKLLTQRITHEEMLRRMDFNSLPVKDPTTGKLATDGAGNLIKTFNRSEQQQFFKMAPRLVSELPVYGPAINKINQVFQPQIDQAAGAKDYKTILRLKKQRDVAWNLYHQNVKQQLKSQGLDHLVPTDQVELPEYENRRIHFTDYDKGMNTQRLLNLESDQSARQSIYRFLNQTKNTEESAIQHARRQKERLYKMVRFLESDKTIKDAGAYRSIIQNTDSVSDAVDQFVSRLRNNDALQETTRQQVSLARNAAASLVNRDALRMRLNSSIQKSNQVYDNLFIPQQPAGTRIAFNRETEDLFKRLDERHPVTGLEPHNRQAVESLLGDIMERYPNMQTALSIDQSIGNARISVFRPEDSRSVTEHLAAGTSHPRALEFELPLINSQGTHVVGGRILNARSYLDKTSSGQFRLSSSSEMIANAYRHNLPSIMKRLQDNQFEEANYRSRQTLNDSINALSGIQRTVDINENDNDVFQHSQKDITNQAQVDVQRGMIRDWIDTGKLNPREDLESSAFINGKLKHNLTLNDVKYNRQQELLREMGRWANENRERIGVPLYISGVKDVHATRGIMSRLDARDFQPFGHFGNQGRPNAIQFTNAFPINEDVQKKLDMQKFYYAYESNVTTPTEDAINELWRSFPENAGNYNSVNLKFGFIDNQTLYKRMEALRESHAADLREMGILQDDGSWNPATFPRVYEQQAAMANELLDSMSYTGHQILSHNEGFELAEGLSEGQIVKPGTIVGTEIQEGVRVPVRWERPYEGRLSMQNGQTAVTYTRHPYKYILEGEKVTPSPVPQKLLQMITGDKDIVGLINPNIQKHQDFNLLLSGQSRILANHLSDLENQIDQSQTQQQAKKLLQQKRNILQAIRENNIPLQWDGQARHFTDISASMRSVNGGKLEINSDALDKVFEAGGISHATKEGIQSGILKTIMSHVEDYSKAVDYTGRRIIGHDENGPIYGSERAGFRAGHREMWSFKQQGLNQTYDLVAQNMIDEAKGMDSYALHARPKRRLISRYDEARNLLNTLSNTVHSTDSSISKTDALSIDKFENLPVEEKTRFGYAGTIFDRQRIQEFGFWLKLPTTKLSNGQEIKPTINLNGPEAPPTPVDRIFMPFTNLEGASGQIHLRNLQQQMAAVYRRAQDVEKQTSISARQKAGEGLQRSINNYFDNIIYQASASKGLIGDTLTTRLSNTFTGRTKVIDPRISRQMNGDYAMISEQRAKDLGIYDRLKAGQAVYGMHTRYPTFHTHASQIAKIKMDPHINDQNIHLNSLLADLTGADSDGDVGHLWVARDAKGHIYDHIQHEWANRYKQDQEYREQLWQQHLADFEKENPHALDQLAGDKIVASSPNNDAEVMARIGKRYIGEASNLGLAMRAASEQYLNNQPGALQAIRNFTQALEQKPISSKHMKEAPERLVPAAELISAVRSQDFDRARAIDEVYYGGEFAGKHSMNEAFEAMNQINNRFNLTDSAFKVGTSRGIRPEKGLRQAYNVLSGNGSEGNLQTNSQLELTRHLLENQPRVRISPKEAMMRDQMYDNSSGLTDRVRPELRKGLGGAAADTIEDLTGNTKGVSQPLGKQTENLFNKLKTSPKFRKGAFLSALALGGLAGYNILRHNQPIDMEEAEQGDGHFMPAPAPESPITSNFQEPETQNADITVFATGHKNQPQMLSQMAAQGIQESYMNPSHTNFNVHVQDNSSKLSRFWYRDQVQKNIDNKVQDND
jgi:predicted PolB exonuclease-like 3'-5' exonuclease